MPETKTASQPTEKAVAKSGTEKAHSLVHTISITFGVLGAIGAAGVWLAANLFIGDLVIQTDKPAEAVVVKVYDKKGQEATYHMKHFQLMPGSYHLEITPDSHKTQHADVEIEFGKTCTVPVVVTDGQEEIVDKTTYKTGKRHWWQFWRN